VDLLLRETTLDDLPILFEHQRDPLANEMAVFAARDWDAFVAHEAKIRCDPTLIRRTVVVDDEVVGSIGCFGDEQRQVGYWYDRAVWGRGIAFSRSTSTKPHRSRTFADPTFVTATWADKGRSVTSSRKAASAVVTTDVEEIVYRLA